MQTETGNQMQKRTPLRSPVRHSGLHGVATAYSTALRTLHSLLTKRCGPVRTLCSCRVALCRAPPVRCACAAGCGSRCVAVRVGNETSLTARSVHVHVIVMLSPVSAQLPPPQHTCKRTRAQNRSKSQNSAPAPLALPVEHGGPIVRSTQYVRGEGTAGLASRSSEV